MSMCGWTLICLLVCPLHVHSSLPPSIRVKVNLNCPVRTTADEDSCRVHELLIARCFLKAISMAIFDFNVTFETLFLLMEIAVR